MSLDAAIIWRLTSALSEIGGMNFVVLSLVSELAVQASSRVLGRQTGGVRLL